MWVGFPFRSNSQSKHKQGVYFSLSFHHSWPKIFPILVPIFVEIFKFYVGSLGVIQYPMELKSERMDAPLEEPVENS